VDASGKLKRKATDNLSKEKGMKKNKTQMPNIQDESSSSSSTSINNNLSKSSKTAAVIAAAAAATASKGPSSSSISPTTTTTTTSPISSASNSSTSSLNEEEVKRYLSRRPMTTKELLHKFRGKTQNTMTNQQLIQNLKIILDKLNAKMIEQNGVKYLSLS
jgi:transcription initiation factor TFIIF subunit alpha